MQKTIKLLTTLLLIGCFMYACSSSSPKKAETKTLSKKISEKELLSMALLNACKKGDFAKVKRTLSLNADVNYIYHKNTPLYAASVNGNVKIVKLLIKHQADLNFRDIAGDTAYSQACMRGHLKVVKALLNAGFKQKHIGYFNANYKNAGFLLACAYNHVKLAKYLRKRFRISVNVTDDSKESALMKAAKFNSLKAIQYLLKSRAKKKLKNKNGFTAYQLALKAKHPQAAALLN